MRKVNRIYEEINEQNVEELYEFMSEEDMKNATPPFSEILATVVSFSQVERIVPTHMAQTVFQPGSGRRSQQ